MSAMYLNSASRGVYFEGVWEVVRQIPSGQVATYGQIAAIVPAPDDIAENT